MKLRIIFLKKKYIYYVVLSLALIILMLVFLFTRKASSTFNAMVNNNRLIQADLTGDGKKDTLYIKTEKDKYYMEVNTGDKIFYLEPDKKLPTAGMYDEFNPLKITLMDITRDKTPEIFVQASQKDSDIQHAFMWIGNSFKDIFCSSNNIIGFSDSSNNKTPKLLSGKMNNNQIELTSYMYMYNKSSLENIVFNYNDNFLGRDSVFAFIKYIEALPSNEANKPVNVFYPGLSGQDLAIIGKLSGEQNIYSFQNGTFRDSKSDKNGKVTEVVWTLNFKAVSSLNKDKVKNYTVSINLKSDGQEDSPNYFKIYKLALN